MRFKNGLKVAIPYMDEETQKYVILSFNGDTDYRRVRRELRKYILSAFGKRVSKEYVSLKGPCQYIVPEPPKPVTDKQVEDWIRSIEDADEDSANPDSQARATGTPEVSLPTVQGEPKECPV